MIYQLCRYRSTFVDLSEVVMNNRVYLKKINKIFGKILLKIISFFRPIVPPINGQKNIVLLKLVGLGDAALMLPVIHLMRQSFPDYTITVLGTPITKFFFIDNPDIDNCIVYDLLDSQFGIKGLFKLLRFLRKVAPSHFIDFEHHFLLTTIVAFLSGAKNRIGLYHPDFPGREFLFTQRVLYDDQIHITQVYYCLYTDLCKLCHKNPLPYEKILSYSIPVGECALKEVESWKVKNGINKKIIGIHPGCGGSALYRRWPMENVRLLIKKLIDTGKYQIILTGGLEEKELLNKIHGFFSNEDVFLGNDFSFKGFVALLKSLDCFVCNDTGPVHISSWLGTMTVGLFGPNLPERYGSIHKSTKILYHPLPCSPCIQVHKGFIPLQCTNFEKGACMNRISVDEVFNEVFNAVEQNRE